jgi:glutamate---cysteine ligase / carboxylate-amine ligase
LIHEFIEFVADEIAELGSRREMNHIERILHEGTGADRQIAVWGRTHDMKAVVDNIVAETYEGLSEVKLEKQATVA